MTDNSEQINCVRKRVSKNPNDKTRLAYWKRRIFKPVYARDGVKVTSPNYCIEVQHKGKRVRWSLGPANPEAAAARARDLYLFVVTNGWEAALARYRPAAIAQADPSVGEFISAVEKSADLSPRTLASYVASLRKIVADLSGLSDSRHKYGHGKAHRTWVERVGSVKLSELSPENIQSWKKSFLSKADQDPVSQRSARVSVNSFLRQAKSLFSPRILKFVSLEMPAIVPFSSVEFEKRGNMKYRSEFDIAQLVRSATEALASSDPEAYKVFLLASFAGLRRKEIDLLEWSAFRFEEGTIRIETTAHFAAKSEDSLGDVAVDQQLLEVFRVYQRTDVGPFVIQSPNSPRTVNYNFYRCEEVFGRLIGWLRGNGVTSKKPLHCLRKECGSMINAAFGIHAASRMMRHSSVAITDQYYSDHRIRATVPGHLLENKVVEFKQAVA